MTDDDLRVGVAPTIVLADVFKRPVQKKNGAYLFEVKKSSDFYFPGFSFDLSLISGIYDLKKGRPIYWDEGKDRNHIQAPDFLSGYQIDFSDLFSHIFKYGGGHFFSSVSEANMDRSIFFRSGCLNLIFDREGNLTWESDEVKKGLEKEIA